MAVGYSFIKQLGLGIHRYFSDWQISPKVIVCICVWGWYQVASLGMTLRLPKQNNQILLLLQAYSQQAYKASSRISQAAHDFSLNPKFALPS